MTRKVVVIGGTSGIGRAIATGFLDAGDEVTVTGHEAVDDLPDGMAQAVLDVRDGAAVTDFFAPMDRLDVLVNCAGVIRRGGAEFTHDGFADVVDINLNGSQRCCVAAHPLMPPPRAGSGNSRGRWRWRGRAMAFASMRLLPAGSPRR